MPEIINSPGNIEAVKLILESLVEKYGIDNLAFISLIKGEYGMRSYIYNSIVPRFISKVKDIDSNIKVVGISFEDTSFFVDDICDIVIEINDKNFNNTIVDTNGNMAIVAEHAKKISTYLIPQESYNGTNGWHPSYITGVYSIEYENIISSMNFKNIIYTTFCDGSYVFTSNSFNVSQISSSLNFGIIRQVPFMDSLIEVPQIKRIDSHLTDENRSIVMFIRNTNKCPERNLPPEIYNAVFSFCMNNKIHLHVFQDLVPVDVPENPLIHNIWIPGSPQLKKMVNLCRKSHVYIGGNSGAGIIAYSQSRSNVLYYKEYDPFYYKNLVPPILFKTANDITSLLKNYFN